VEALSVLPASCTGLVHGFTGDFPTAKRYLDKGLHLGIGPRYKRSKHFADLARLPLEQIVLESDAPIGSTNIGDVARELTASDASAGELLVRATANAKRLFGIT
jgi:Tat protein secretion system quality control protein TatD with DNase activity